MKISKYLLAVLFSSFLLTACASAPTDDAVVDAEGEAMEDAVDAPAVDEAMEEFKVAFTNPFYETPYLAYSNAGNCLMNVKNYAMAEKFLRKALRKKPELADALLTMAEIGIKTKKYLMARAYAQRFHAVSKPIAESLWVQVQAEKYLGATKHYLKYAKQLLKEFPDSQQAVWVHELARNDRTRKN